MAKTVDCPIGDLVDHCRESTLVVEMPDKTVIRNVPKGMVKVARDLERLYANWTQQSSQPHGTLEEIDFAVLTGLKKPLGPGESKFDRKLAEALAVPGKGEAQDLQEKYGRWIDFTEIENKYQNDLKQLSTKRAEIWIYAFLFWLASIGLVYLLGAAVGWVARGFRGGH
jgi:hypothetical protein